MPFTIRASKEGQIVETTRISPTIAVAKARMLVGEGWQVNITDSQNQQLMPEMFDQLLSFDRTPGLKIQDADR
jgi:hypothetical protein